MEVSALCLGAMYFGTRNDKTTSYRMLDQYVDAGGSFIDTANIYASWVSGYAGGESESLLGEWMKERGNRSDLFIASKVGFSYGDVPKRLTARLIEQECDRSLKRLGVDTIDLYYAHVDDYDTPLKESLEAFDRLVKAGKVRFTGASNYLAWRLERAKCVSKMNDWTQFCCIQQRYTYLRPKPGTTFAPQVAVNDDLLDYCRHNDMTLLAYSVLLSGAYTRRDRGFPDRSRARTACPAGNVKAVAESGATVNRVILHGCSGQSAVSL
jgi:aryl-alcohol dehydrogenase-like predicted oxidoreductase